ncbi:hypothetical protein J3F83DRAFT_738377 [Trichoderma novae-zelandiae]
MSMNCDRLSRAMPFGAARLAWAPPLDGRCLWCVSLRESQLPLFFLLWCCICLWALSRRVRVQRVRLRKVQVLLLLSLVLFCVMYLL